MIFNKKNLLEFENAYEELNRDDELADNLAENLATLNSLTDEEQRLLARNLVLNCPQEQLRSLNSAVQAIYHPLPKSDSNSFYEVLNSHLQVRQKILALTDEKNKHAHNLFYEERDLLNHCSELALECLKGNEVEVVTQLALKITDRASRSHIMSTVSTIFPESNFSKLLGSAFILLREIEDKLFGESPHDFFLSPEFNANYYVKFPKLLQLAENQETIHARLIKTPEVKRSRVLERIDQAYPNSVLAENTRQLFNIPQKTQSPKSNGTFNREKNSEERDDNAAEFTITR